jgi:hypothetical protein
MTASSTDIVTITGWLFGSNSPPITFSIDIAANDSVSGLRDKIREQEEFPPRTIPIDMFKAVKPLSELLELKSVDSEWPLLLAMDDLISVFELDALPKDNVHVVVLSRTTGESHW